MLVNSNTRVWHSEGQPGLAGVHANKVQLALDMGWGRTDCRLLKVLRVSPGQFRGHHTCLFAEAAPLRSRCEGFLVPFALAVLQGFGDVGGVDEVGALQVGDGAADLRALGLSAL